MDELKKTEFKTFTNLGVNEGEEMEHLREGNSDAIYLRDSKAIEQRNAKRIRAGDEQEVLNFKQTVAGRETRPLMVISSKERPANAVTSLMSVISKRSRNGSGVRDIAPSTKPVASVAKVTSLSMLSDLYADEDE
jgi:hypothetical protein